MEQVRDALIRAAEAAYGPGRDACALCDSVRHADGTIAHDEDCPEPYIERALAELTAGGISLQTLPEQPVEWYWAESFDAEAWHGRAATRDAAVANAVADRFFAVLDGFWLVSGQLRLPQREIPDELVRTLLARVEADPCWFEDCGIDAEVAFAERGEPGGLKTVLARAFEHWLATECDLSAQRMIDDFQTLEYYRKVELGDGLFAAVLDPETVP